MYSDSLDDFEQTLRSQLEGQTASRRSSVLTGRERLELVQRTREERSAKRKEAKSEAERQKTSPKLRAGATLNPPIEGVVGLRDWKDFVKRIWSDDKRVVIHSIQIPPGRNPRDLVLENAQIVEEKRTRLPAGVIPPQTIGPADNFEVYVEQNVIHVDKPVPNHFLVVGTSSQQSG